MPIILVALLLAFGGGLGYLHLGGAGPRGACARSTGGPRAFSSPKPPDPQRRRDERLEQAWLLACQARFARAEREFGEGRRPDAKVPSGPSLAVRAPGARSPDGARGLVVLYVTPGGGVLVAGTTAPSDGRADAAWRDRTGHGLAAPDFSFVAGNAGRSAFVAGEEADAGRRLRFARAFVGAAEDCLGLGRTLDEQPASRARGD